MTASKLSRRGQISIALLVLAALFGASVAMAALPRDWHFASGRDFARGKLSGLALHQETGLTVAPGVKRTGVDAELIHCWARDGRKLWLGTGLSAKVFVVQGGKAKMVAKLPGVLVGSLVPDGKGGVFAGTVGRGKVMRVSASGKVEEVVRLKGVRHIWSLLIKDGTLYAGTGRGGGVFAIDPAAKTAKLYAETGAEHVMTLIADGDAIIAGTSDAATLVRITGEKKAQAIAGFPGVEVRSVTRLGKALYVAVNGGNTAAALSRLRATRRRPGGKGKIAVRRKKRKKRAIRGGKGAVWVRHDDGRINRLFISPNGMLTDIGASGQGVVAGTIAGGRVVIGDLQGNVMSLFDLDETQVLGIEMGAKGPKTLMTGKGAAVYSVGGAAKNPTYTTEVLRAGGVTRWGRIAAGGSGSLIVETRSGYSNPPSDTWSPWQPLANERSQSPAASYLQVRVRFASPDARLWELRIFRRPFNRAPSIKRLTIKPNKKLRTLRVTWSAKDPDGGRLGYILTYRKRGSTQWLMLHDRFYAKTSMTLSPRDMPDGWYELRVEATDAPNNTPSEALRTALISKPFLVDQGRPDVSAQVRDGMLTGVAADRVSNIVRVVVSFDGEPAVLARCGDNICDGRQEAFELKLPPDLLKGRHTLLIQATDEAGNTGVQRLVIGK
ncbi:MAG: hypothetical protein KC502_03355 [Myxococcales bacterium]|nr:hypothetical protein [Myxococcales bacterium]